MKRGAGQDLTKEVLKTPDKKEEEKQDTPEEIAGRRILKIKGTKAQEKKEEQSCGFKLTTPLIAQSDEKKEDDNNKEKPFFPSGGLFGSTGVSIFTQPATGGLFSNLQGAKPAGQPTTGLFGNSTGLFGQQQQQQQQGGLFGSLPAGWLKSGPPEKEQEEEDDEEGGNEPLEDKSEGNPEESKANYEYQIDFEKIVNVSVVVCPQFFIDFNQQIQAEFTRSCSLGVYFN